MSRTPEQTQRWLDENLHRMDQPAQYLGDEAGSGGRDWDTSSVRWLMAASWPYFHSAGNQSVPAVTAAIHGAGPDYLCDRSYLPETPRDLRMLEKAGLGVFGVETRRPLMDFDVAATSISYMVLFMNWCKLLAISGVPLRRSEREADGPEKYPMVMVGGQAYGVPGAMEPVVDCIWLGEVEDEPGNGGIGQVLARIAAMKQSGMWQSDRPQCYELLALEFSYLYFPKFTEVQYGYLDMGLEHPSKQVTGWRTTLPGLRAPFRARKVTDMDQIRPLVSAPLLYSDPSMGAGDIEVARGCPAWCGFCRLSWETKPYRQRDVDLSIAHAAEWRRNMGSVELSPFGPDFPMHTQKKRLLAGLLEQVGGEIDGTAMRIDDFAADHQYVMLQAFGGADAVTLGLEGNSQRMRDLVGKGTTDQDVEDAVIQGIKAGFRKFKLYMITSLPGEDTGDVMRIVALARRLCEIRDQMGQPNVRIQLSWTPLLIEGQTPFQWFAVTLPDHTLIDVIEQLRDYKVECKIGTKAEPNKITLFQLCQRASRDVGEAIVDVLEKHGVGSWGGVPTTFRADLDEALRAHGFRNGLGDCFGERGRLDMFGWEYISTGVSPELLWTTYRQMLEFLLYTDSETYDEAFGPDYHGGEWVSRCDTTCLGRGCGACSPADLRKRTRYIRAAQREQDIDLTTLRPVDQTTVACKIRIKITKQHARHRFVTNDSWRYLIRRAAYQAAHELTGLPGGIAARSIRLASDSVKVRVRVAGSDYAEFGWTVPLSMYDTACLRAAMQSNLSPWLSLGGEGGGDWAYMDRGVRIDKAADLALYELEAAEDLDTLRARLEAWDNAAEVPMTLRTDSAYFGSDAEEVNAKDLAPDIWVTRDGHRLLLRMLVRRAGPYHIYSALARRASLIEASAVPARRLDFFLAATEGQADALRPDCGSCGRQLPVDLLDVAWPHELCPRCRDEVIAGLHRGVLT